MELSKGDYIKLKHVLISKTLNQCKKVIIDVNLIKYN
jgi:hypothetical protein